jgi:hypothetical protein
MGQGANITISNFSPHVLNIAVTQSDYTTVSTGLAGIMHSRSGLRPVYIEGTGVTSESHLTLSLTVMKPSSAGGYEPDPSHAVSHARMQLTGSHWEPGQQTNGALIVNLEIASWTQDVITIFLGPAQ